mmetsp:Transcript_1510/g.3258  ORF Transcript_1510/g.3258 Transcript_1510/m.3258 type:complete len:371 (-) Transcript_1510:460-1572(-)
MFPVRLRTNRKDGPVIGIEIPVTSRSSKPKKQRNLTLKIFFSVLAVIGLFVASKDLYLIISTVFIKNHIQHGVKSVIPQEKMQVRFPGLPPCFETVLPIGPYETLEKDDLLTGLPMRERTTVVIMSSSLKNVEYLQKILPLYGGMPGTLDRILLLWNNQKDCPPELPVHTKVDMFVIPQSKNSPNNRMGEDVLKYSRTRSILYVSDDVFLPNIYVRTLLYKWVEKGPDSIVGDLADRGYAHPTGGYSALIPKMFKVKGKPKKHNIVSTRSMVLGRKWVESYKNLPDVRSFVDAETGCQSIMLSALVRKNTGRNDPIFITNPNEHPREDLLPAGLYDQKEGADILDGRRNRCVFRAMDIFGKNIWDPKEKK